MHAIVDKMARLFALLGGLVLATLIVLTCLSVVGRSLNSILHGDTAQSWLPDLANAVLAMGVGPINGDFELVEAGMAFTIFAFLPICQMNGAHASVDIFTAFLPPRTDRILRTVTEIVFAGVMCLIAVQLFAGMESKRGSGQTTFLLEFPVWWAYALSLSGGVGAAVVAVYFAVMRSAELVTGRCHLPGEREAEQ